MFVSVVNIKFYVFSKMISILFIFGHSYWFKNNIIMVLWGLNYIFRMIKIDKTKNSLYRLSVSVSADMEINYRYRLSVSADMKIEFIGDYRYRPIWKKAYRSYPDICICVIWRVVKKKSIKDCAVNYIQILILAHCVLYLYYYQSPSTHNILPHYHRITMS